MERRDFIRAAILGSLATATGIKSAAAGTAAGSSAAGSSAAGTAAGAAATSGLDEAEAFADASNQLVAVMGGTPEAMYKKGIAEMGGIKRFISKGDKVVVKPNIGWDKAPEFAADTNQQIIVAIVKAYRMQLRAPAEEWHLETTRSTTRRSHSRRAYDSNPPRFIRPLSIATNG